MNPSARTTDDYLKFLPADQAKALEKLRKQIIAAAPGCEEYFGYGLPGFKLHGIPCFTWAPPGIIARSMA